MSDFDSPWKEILDYYFQLFLALLFPRVHVDIDWVRGYETLDKELQQVLRDAELGRRVVDKLVRVWLKNGQEEWLLIHVEVQTQPEADFPERMFVYNYRLFDRYNRKVVSLAVLADDQESWRPDRYGYDMWDFSILMRFPTVKLLDFVHRQEELEANPNPFAVVVLAHVKTLETRRDPHGRQAWKFRLVKNLYERGLDATVIRNLFRFIDWVMDLPKDLNNSFLEEVQQLEEVKRMPYITSIERIGIEKGRLEGEKIGLVKAISWLVKRKFASDAQDILPEIQAIEDQDLLQAILLACDSASSVAELRKIWKPS